MFENIEFANPEFLYLLIISPLMIVWYILRKRRQSPTISVSSTDGFKAASATFRQRLRHLLPVFRALAAALFIIVLARPQTSSTNKSVKTEGIDIVIALDVSTSMLAEDFKPNRIEAAKKYAREFIEERQNDRIGLVVFSGESFTQCPVTIDHNVLKNLFGSVKSGMIEDGTAIGMGLATAVNRLKETESKSKVVILLTDGVNNTGFIAPQTAADIASTYGIRVYTIGIGSKGKAPFPFKMRTWSGKVVTRYQNVDVKIDEEILKSIANTTNGKYFRATNNKALRNIYQEIDKLEKTKIDVSYYSRFDEKFLPFAIAGAILFLLEILLRYTVFRSLP